MTNSLLFDFIVDKQTNSVYVKREFEAEQQLVWDAFTKPAILDLWWAPKPWVSKTKYMNFEVGGRRFYAMLGQEGQEHWAVEDYTAIEPTKSYSHISAFADKDENINKDFSGSEWNLDFSEAEDITTVSVFIKYKSLAILENMIKMGFKEGFTMGLNNLSELLTSLKK